MAVSFLTPLGGATALVVLAAALAALLRERRARRLREALGLGPPGARAKLPSLLAVLAIGLLALAAAQPVVREAKPALVRNDAEAVFLFDRSRSMLAAPSPGAPDRFDRAVEVSLELRSALADVRSGVASIGEDPLPHLFPSADATAFDLVVRRALGVERPPPVGERDELATDLEEIGDLATDGYFSPAARRRLAVVLTDGESEPFSAATVADELRDGDVGLVVIRVGGPRERIYGRGGAPEAYQLDEQARTELTRLAREAGGRLYTETEGEAALRAARKSLGVGPTVTVAEEKRPLGLAPYAVAAALLVLAALFATARPSRLSP